MAKNILFPIGRLIGGSVHKMRPRTEPDGKTPKLDKEGKAMQVVSFGVAFPKTQADWKHEPWGHEMFEVAKAAFPQMHLSPAFAYKVIDGDSAVPNKNGKLPCNMTGHKGHWVIWFSQGWVPKLVTADGAAELAGDKFVPGYYVQVYADIAGNGATPPNTPGLYVNPVAVALAGEGEVINVEVDTTSVGFGGAPLPAGATPVKPAEVAFAAPAPAPASAAGVPVVPNAAFMQAPPAAPPAAPRKVMTAKAGGAAYEAFVAQGWTDAAMIEQGYMVVQ